MYNESTDSRSGRAAPNKTRMPTRRAGRATEVTSAAGRAISRGLRQEDRRRDSRGHN